MKNLLVSIVFISLMPVSVLSETYSQGVGGDLKFGYSGYSSVSDIPQNQVRLRQFYDESIENINDPFKVSTVSDPLNVRLPTNVSKEKAAKIQDLLKQLQGICPECSNGGTPGGEIIVGPNAGDGTPLFGSNLTGLNNCIKRDSQEYINLKDKADRYDQLMGEGQ